MINPELAVRQYLRSRAGHPVKRSQLCADLHMSRGGLGAAVDGLTLHDPRVYEENDGRLNYLTE